MNIEEYERMYELEGTYWWFQGRKKIIHSLLGRYMPREPRPMRVLDVGCGTGLMMQSLSKWKPVGVDFSGLALEFCASRGLENLVRADVVKLPFRDKKFDLILALDLMEHVEDDHALIREFSRVLRPGGTLIATVPAHPKLWSDHDVALHHFRRYTHKSFRDLLSHGGFKPVKYTYAISALHPLIVLFRTVQRAWQNSTGADRSRAKAHLIPLPGPLNSALIQLLRLEAAALRHVSFPFGTSLVTVARRTKR